MKTRIVKVAVCKPSTWGLSEWGSLASILGIIVWAIDKTHTADPHRWNA